MSIPPGFLDELRTRLSLSDVVGRKVIWDARKSTPGKGDFWAPCPFHQEKTPSFHVDDRKGFYYCFGCHQKGDMITFVKETDNVSFIEAVEMLAREAGMEMPARTRDPGAAERRDRHAALFDVMEQAVRFFRRTMGAAAGGAARDYVQKRALTGDAVARFELGFAPESRVELTRVFQEKGQLDEAVACGLVIRPDDGGAPYDRFRNRLMFPIRDARGRCIAFGGRAMDPNARAKYLNSPETEIFHKGRTLYNHGPAREAAGKAGALIVAEGYMDVIALAQAGFDHAVAPLGTAITEDQLALMWRIADEPLIALDGDTAGLRAAHRLVDLALPMLAPGKSLRFCLMPEGRDPDDLIRAEGPAGMQAALDAAVPLIELFWRRETGGDPLDTPERRAALDQRLRAALERIADRSVRDHYAADLRDRRRALFRPADPGRAGGQGAAFGQRGAGTRGRSGRMRGMPASPARETLASDLARRGSGGAAEARIREAAILLIALRNPGALAEVETALETMSCVTPEFAGIRDGLIAALADGADPCAFVATRIGQDPEHLLTAVPQARAHPLTRRGADAARVALEIAEALAKHEAQLSHEQELIDARRDLGEDVDETWSARIRQANLEREKAIAHGASVGRNESGEDEADYLPARLLESGAWRRRRGKRETAGKKT